MVPFLPAVPEAPEGFVAAETNVAVPGSAEDVYTQAMFRRSPCSPYAPSTCDLTPCDYAKTRADVGPLGVDVLWGNCNHYTDEMVRCVMATCGTQAVKDVNPEGFNPPAIQPAVGRFTASSNSTPKGWALASLLRQARHR